MSGFPCRLQSNVRRFLAQSQAERLRLSFYSAVLIQKVFRGFIVRRRAQREQRRVVRLQALARGYLVRKR